MAAAWIATTTFSEIMMTSSNGNIFRVTGPLCGEFTGPGEFPTQRPATRRFDVYFDLRLNKRLSKQPWGWWFETLSWSLWRHRNGNIRNIHGNFIQNRFKSFIVFMLILIMSWGICHKQKLSKTTLTYLPNWIWHGWVIASIVFSVMQWYIHAIPLILTWLSLKLGNGWIITFHYFSWMQSFIYALISTVQAMNYGGPLTR